MTDARLSLIAGRSFDAAALSGTADYRHPDIEAPREIRAAERRQAAFGRDGRWRRRLQTAARHSSSALQGLPTLEVGGDGVDRRPDLVADLAHLEVELVLVRVDQLHAAADLGQQLDAVPLLELADGALQDHIGHLRQVRQRLVAMDASLQV